jgi:hypothetical protein
VEYAYVSFPSLSISFFLSYGDLFVGMQLRYPSFTDRARRCMSSTTWAAPPPRQRWWRTRPRQPGLRSRFEASATTARYADPRNGDCACSVVQVANDKCHATCSWADLDFDFRLRDHLVTLLQANKKVKTPAEVSMGFFISFCDCAATTCSWRRCCPLRTGFLTFSLVLCFPFFICVCVCR